MKTKTAARALGIAVIGTLAAAAAAGPPSIGFPGLGGPADPVKVSVEAPAAAAPGSDLVVAVVFDLAPGWHIWPHRVDDLPEGYESYDSAILTVVGVSAPDDAPLGLHPEFATWPEIHAARADIGDGPRNYAVYEGRAVVGIPVTVTDDATPGVVTLTVRFGYQACNDRVCLQPVDEERDVTIRIDPAATVVPPADVVTPDVFEAIRSGADAPEPPAGTMLRFDLFGISFTIDTAGTGLVILLLLAAAGGFLLNLTPCVLPVIPLKIMGLSQSAAGHRGRTLALGIAMTLGVVGFWLLLGGLIAGLSGFTSTNQLFQYPAFTIGVGVFIAVMAVGMCGLFSVQLPKAVYVINPSHETLHGSFVFGVMAAVLSTPCTAPFMGVAAAFAALQGPTLTLVTFAAIGAGMAAPYIVLAAFPALVRKMPRTGPASELIKQVMGLLMLAAAAYFAGVGVSGLLVTPPDPPSRLYWWFVGLFGLAAGLWLAWRTIRITPAFGRRLVFGGLGLVIAAASVGIGLRMTDKGPIDWVYYTPERFAEARAAGNVVVMEFTAEWCLNCKALEETVLRDRNVVTRLSQDGVVPMKVDLTGNNTMGNAMLAEVQRLTIPLLVVFDPDGVEVFKGDYYTPDQVLDAIERARAQPLAAR